MSRNIICDGERCHVRSRQLRGTSAAQSTKARVRLKSHYDFIVWGSGTSGSVVAARLAADVNTQVLLREAGGTDETDVITTDLDFAIFVLESIQNDDN